MINTILSVSSIVLLLEIAVLFYLVTLAVQIFQARFGDERIRRWMGGSPMLAALKGIAIGFVTPFCTFTAVPMLVGLRQARVPPAGYVAFIVAAPVLDPVLFGALWLIAGLEVAAIYASIAFVAALGLAFVAERTGIERHLRPIDSLVDESQGCSASCVDTSLGWAGWKSEVASANRRAISLLRGMAPILLVGVVLSLLIEQLVPPEVTERLTSTNPRFAIPIAAAVGTPLYVSTAVFVPIADALTAAGVGTGAIVALTIAGAGANLPEFVILSKLARPPIIGSFFAYVFGVAVVGGLVTQAVV